MKGSPIPKKVYNPDKRYSDWQYQPINGFKVIFDNYLKKIGLVEKYEFKNEFSRADYFVTSAHTTTGKEKTIVLEYKNRKMPLAKYIPIIEKDKLEKGLQLAELIEGSFLYVCEYEDGCLGWFIDKYFNLKSDRLPMQKSEINPTKVLKDVFYLPYEKANIIIAKKKQVFATKDELTEFVKRKYNEHRN